MLKINAAMYFKKIGSTFSLRAAALPRSKFAAKIKHTKITQNQNETATTAKTQNSEAIKNKKNLFKLRDGSVVVVVRLCQLI